MDFVLNEMSKTRSKPRVLPTRYPGYPDPTDLTESLARSVELEEIVFFCGLLVSRSSWAGTADLKGRTLSVKS